MKNLFALFSAKKEKNELNTCSFVIIGPNDLRKIRGGGQPANRDDINIIIAD
jgi:hypothetical protein